MYVVGFVAAWWLGCKRAPRIGLTKDDIGDLLFYCAIGVVAGGRLGYALFYGLEQWMADPLWIFRVWDGGMSFHGGLMGVLLAAWLFARRKQLAFFTLTDFPARADWPGGWAHRQLHQPRAARPRDLASWGKAFPAWAQSRATSAPTKPYWKAPCCSSSPWWVSAKPVRAGSSPACFCWATASSASWSTCPHARRPHRLPRLWLVHHGHAPHPA